jgi:hypothetical protein
MSFEFLLRILRESQLALALLTAMMVHAAAVVRSTDEFIFHGRSVPHADGYVGPGVDTRYVYIAACADRTGYTIFESLTNNGAAPLRGINVIILRLIHHGT